MVLSCGYGTGGRLSGKDGATYGSVGRAPHLFEVEFFDAGFVRGDGRALNADTVFEDGIGGVDGHLVVGLL